MTAATRPTLFTIGHSKHPIERFLGLLASADVEVVADVRRYPGSRRNPQFGAGALAESLTRASAHQASCSVVITRRRVAA